MEVYIGGYVPDRWKLDLRFYVGYLSRYNTVVAPYLNTVSLSVVAWCWRIFMNMRMIEQDLYGHVLLLIQQCFDGQRLVCRSTGLDRLVLKSKGHH